VEGEGEKRSRSFEHGLFRLVAVGVSPNLVSGLILALAEDLGVALGIISS
jgi:hypothetical protein